MPRPADLTPEFLAACEAEIDTFRRAQRLGLDPGPRIPDAAFYFPHFREAWICGAWLHERLRAAGCPDSQARDICFANGQRIAMSADPWAPTLHTLQRYLAGEPPDTPGDELAARLLGGEEQP